MADYRDFDRVVRRIEASGGSITQATQNLRQKLQTGRWPVEIGSSLR